jgi:GTPase
VVLFVNSPSLFDATYQRYLLNVFREKLPFHDVPIKLYLRARSKSDPAGEVVPTDPTADAGSRVRRTGSNPQPPSRTPAPVWAHEQLNVTELDREVNELLSDLDE